MSNLTQLDDRLLVPLLEDDEDDYDDHNYDEEPDTDEERRRVFETEWDYTRPFTAY